MKRLTNLIEPTNVIIVSDAYINGDRIVCRSGNDDFDLWAKDLKKASVIMEFTGIDAHKPVQDMTVKEAAEVDESTKRLNENWMKQYFNDYKEQKPAEWSEEDEKIITRLIDYFESFRIAGVVIKWEGLDIQEVITLLKSLRPQPKQEWSEEDEKRIQRICDFLWKNRKGDTDTIYQIEKDVDWLKSLRPSWKPSEEQIKALKYAAYHTLPGEEYRDILFSLLKDLTKLM